MDSRDALRWQWEMGAVDFIAAEPRDWTLREKREARGERREDKVPDSELENKTIPQAAVSVSPLASRLSLLITDLPALRAALENFDGLEIKKSATQMVFGDGTAQPRVVVIGEAPGADEDRIGRPFVGVAGKLLDKMLAAIGLSRETNSYITNVINWRPPGNRQPTPQEIMVSLPYLQKHIELLNPEFLLIVGGTSMKALFNVDQGITRARGSWMDYVLPNGKTIPALITFHPAYLLRAPAQKALAWRDLLALKSRLGATANT